VNQWRTRSQYCPKGGAWITGSWPVKATSGWQHQAASCSPRHSSAGTVASPRIRALGTPRRCSRLTEWRRPCAGRESMSRRPTTIGWAQPPSADQERRMFPPRSVPACVPSQPDGLGLSRSPAQARKRASGRAHRLRELSRISRVPRGIIDEDDVQHRPP
jgi:hypothetical protein